MATLDRADRPFDPVPTTGRRHDDRRLRRRVAAALMVLPGFCVAAATVISPVYGLEGTDEIVRGLAGHTTRYQVGLWLGVVAFLTLVPAFLAAGRLARRRRPLLATAATAVNGVAYLGLGLGLASVDALMLVASRQPGGDQPEVIAFLEALEANAVFGLSAGLFVIGHVLGAVLMGLALRGSVPTWAWVTMAISQPGHFVAYVLLQEQVLDAATWALTGVALSACAVAVVRTRDDDWDLAPSR
jgi:hypothetical protein